MIYSQNFENYAINSFKIEENQLEIKQKENERTNRKEKMWINN